MPSPFFRRVAATTPLKSSDIRNAALLIAVVSMFLLYLTWFVFFVMGLFSADWARHAQFWIDSVTPFGGGLITQKKGLDLRALPIDSTAGQGMPRDGLGAWFVLWIGIMACFAMAGATFCEARKAGGIFAPAPPAIASARRIVMLRIAPAFGVALIIVAASMSPAFIGVIERGPSAILWLFGGVMNFMEPEFLSDIVCPQDMLGHGMMCSAPASEAVVEKCYWIFLYVAYSTAFFLGLQIAIVAVIGGWRKGKSELDLAMLREEWDKADALMSMLPSKEAAARAREAMTRLFPKTMPLVDAAERSVEMEAGVKDARETAARQARE